MQENEGRKWLAQDSVGNSQFLVVAFPDVFDAMGEIDRVGHAVLEGALAYQGGAWETTVGLSFLRRSVTQFGGVRYLLQRSSVQPASILARAHFETLLASRVLVYGAKRYVSGLTPSTATGRERRARLYRAEELRREVYRRKAALDGRFGRRFIGAKVRAGVQEEIDDKVAFLQRHFRSQQSAFGPFRCFPQGKRKPQYYDELPWYSHIFGRARRRKMRSLRALAIAVGWGQAYELIYDAFSGFTHVRGCHHDTVVEPGSIAVRVPHAPDDFEPIALSACRWQLLQLSFLTRAYNPAGRVAVGALSKKVAPAIDQLSSKVPFGAT